MKVDTNAVLRRFRYALNVSDAEMLRIFRISDCVMNRARLAGLLKKEDDPDFMACSEELLSLFLDGLIVYNRGRREPAPAPRKTPPDRRQGKARSPGATNNEVLKKLRIALELSMEDLLEIFSLAGVRVSKGELSALFRKETHKNYRECGDQFLRHFFRGLALRHRM